jgi:hypothetical protein
MNGSRFLRIIKYLERNRVAMIHQSGDTDQGLSFSVNFHQFRQFIKGPGRNGVLKLIHHLGIMVREALEGFARLGAEIGAELCEAAVHIKLSAVLIDHFVIHEEMRRELLKLKVTLLADRALFLPEIPDQNVKQMFLRHLTDPVTFEESLGVLRNRNAVAAKSRRKALHECPDLLLQHAGNEPLAAPLIHLIQREKRHNERDTVSRAAGIEVVIQRH